MADQKCPVCGNRVIGEGDRRANPDETICTPITCSAWDVTATFDRKTWRWVPISNGPDNGRGGDDG